ncbi:uncharacterized protein N7473_006559 [Penicillium subrubescens]|uniref:15.0 kDa protein in dhaT-dhaS intergenic region n=1 Tax=Penicillium subrubescens TaxID=1316194 RepID=A0A1Q5TK54_9EURO|nr:uncharacterized protein N7473_006559 [Penicillium subrubescens]KAJ5890331.1 hypothetical protein N7473_006559 [Penicillium subrubescens]OKP00603.1 hypothetical protein PENSUB_7748 [Penicillium subrubescens]
MMTKSWILAGCMMFAFSNATSTNLLQERNIPLNLALEIAESSVQACAKDGYSVSAAVVGRDGILRALLRADQAAIHTPEAARRKAYTSASSRTATSAMVKNIQNPGASQLVSIDDFLILAGGVPIKVGNETIGAVGVGGAPSGDLDEACALAALRKVAGKLD